MNDRIKELFKRAGGKSSKRNLMSNPVQVVETHELWDERIEKFAELIVKECADAADMAQDAHCAYPGDYVAEYMGFGTEEGITTWRDKI